MEEIVITILDWLNSHIGMQGTVVFAFLLIIVILVIFFVIKNFIFNLNSGKTSWYEEAGRLKRELHRVEKEYYDFLDGLSNKQKIHNKIRIQSLKDRISSAKMSRKKHFKQPHKKKLSLGAPTLLVILIVLLIYYLAYHTNILPTLNNM